MAGHDPENPAGARTASFSGASAQPELVDDYFVVQPGDAVGPYVVDALCGAGGFGSVYRAHDAGGRAVALKMLHWYLAGDAQVALRFQQEVRAARSVRHPSIVTIYDEGVAKTAQPYYTMEWLEGRTLKHELETRSPMTLRDAAAILRSLCGGLAAAHAAGVVHRDLKPSNVMLVPRDGERVPVLVDFGIAKVFETDTGRSLAHTRSDVRVGSPHIMAPEQIRGGKIDGRTDIYALGALLYSMLTCRPPFPSSDPLELQMMHLESPPPRASAFAPVPEAVDRVIATCMSKSQDDRYASVADLLDAVEAIASERGEVHASSAPLRRESPAFAVHLSARANDDSDEVLDALDAQIETAREALLAEGFAIVTDTSDGFVAVTLLSPEPATARSQRRALLDRLLALGSTATAGLSVSVAAHVGSVTLARSSGAPQYVDGDVLRTHEWTAVHPRTGVVATDAAVRGLDQDFTLTELTSTPTLRYAVERS